MLRLTEGGFCSLTLLERTSPNIKSYWNSQLGEVNVGKGRLLSPTSLSSLAIQTGGPVRWDYAHELPFDLHPSVESLTSLRFLSVPLHDFAQDRVGALVLGHPSDDLYSDKRMDALLSIASLVSLGLQNSKAYQLALKLGQGRERESIARDLHGSVAQQLFAIELQMGAMLECSEVDDLTFSKLRNLQRSITLANTALRDAMIMTRDEDGSDCTAAALIKQEIDAHVECGGAPASLIIDDSASLLTEAQAKTLRLIIREALLNIRKHANASFVSVSIRSVQGKARLCVQDDGEGMAAANDAGSHKRFGLADMARLAELAGGSLELRQGDECGLMVRVDLPLFDGRVS